MGLCANLPAGSVVPSEKTRVWLEPSSYFGGIYSKIHEKTAFFSLSFNKVPKNYQRPLNGGGARPYGTPVAQGMFSVEKNDVGFREEPNFSPRAPKQKAITHGFGHFSWACPGILKKRVVGRTILRAL